MFAYHTNLHVKTEQLRSDTSTTLAVNTCEKQKTENKKQKTKKAERKKREVKKAESKKQKVKKVESKKQKAKKVESKKKIGRAHV